MSFYIYYIPIQKKALQMEYQILDTQFRHPLFSKVYYQDGKCEHDEAKIKKNGLAYVVTKLLTTGNYLIRDYQVINDNFVTGVPLAFNLY
jgi:hypothetical protein